MDRSFCTWKLEPMTARLLRFLSATFAFCILMAALLPEPDAGCNAYWYAMGPNDPPTIVVGCQADLGCTLQNGGFCSPHFTAAGPDAEMVCACPNMSHPRCRVTFIWRNTKVEEIPRQDSSPINPHDWRCAQSRCQNPCDKETSVDTSLPPPEPTLRAYARHPLEDKLLNARA
jgi:hypothetical protein